MPPPPPRSPARKAPPAGPADDAGAGPSKQTLRLLQAEMKEMRDLHAAEKGALRRESEQHRKRALGLQRELERAQVQLQSRTSDVTALKAALRTREERVQSAERRAVETEEAALRARQATVEKLCAAEAERDELKTLLLATLKRLESVEEAVQRSDVAAAVMTEKLRTLEFEREKALNVAAASREEASMLTQAHRRLESELDMLRRLQAQATTRNAARKGALRAALNDQSGARDRLRRAMDALGCESGSDDACACGDESSSDCSPLVGRGGLASRMPPALRVRP
ncbi:unnamed protein product [Pedinophyceae sp. YPF-701]|nr:unnamed protein product [Pedinophyceae sp. YPF-701]